jgi:hypothetical protein
MHGHVPANPARGEAQGRNDLPAERVLGESDRRRELKPRSRRHDIRRSTAFLIHTCFQPAADHPDENQSGRAEDRARTARGPGRTEMPLESPEARFGRRVIRAARPPGRGSNPAKGTSEPQERRRARNCSGGHTRTSVTRLPVDVCVARMAEGRTTRLARPRESPEPW